MLADRFFDDGIEMETAPLALRSRCHTEVTEGDLHELPHDLYGFPRVDERGEDGRPTKLTAHCLMFNTSGGDGFRSWFC